MPKKNGDRHASEICSAALSLRDACQIIDRPDMRNRTIEIMAGVHTGAIVADDAGNRMPRSVVFGRDQGCQMAKFDPFLSLDCARVEGVGA